jgi:hypothetical protein
MGLPREVADPTYAVADYLATELGVVTGNISTGLRVFAPSLPVEEESHMPNPCVVVSHHGGGHLFGKSTLPVMDTILRINAYGSTRLQGDTLARKVTALLHELKASTWEDIKLFWARIATAPVADIDTTNGEVNWPYSYILAQVMHNIYVHE